MRPPREGCGVPLSADYPTDFRVRAEELRSVAAGTKDEKAREALLKCAADYEKLADQFELAAAQGGIFKPPRP